MTLILFISHLFIAPTYCTYLLHLKPGLSFFTIGNIEGFTHARRSDEHQIEVLGQPLSLSPLEEVSLP